jgi:glycosyltransferase 2 family protein
LNKSKIKILFGLLFSLLTIVFIIYYVDLEEVWKNIQNISLRIIGLVLILYIINMIVRALRWNTIIKQRSYIPFYIVFKALIYGYMLNQLLPAKVGELGRAEYLARKSDNSRSYLLGSIIVERIFDMVVISMFLGISVLYSATIMSQLRSNIIPVILILLGIVGVFIIIYNIKLLKYITQYLPVVVEYSVNRLIDNVSRSFIIFSSLRNIIIVFILTFIIWGITCFTFYLVLYDLNVILPIYAYLFIVSAGTFGMIIPSTSANVGVYHAVAMGALMIFMVPASQALSFAVVAHAFDFFPSIILGGVLFGYGKVNEFKKESLLAGINNNVNRNI